jgi:tRNA uridine 5-carboxymethylaminomethyl modification enzyme
LISDARYRIFINKKEFIDHEMNRLQRAVAAPGEALNQILARRNSPVITTGCTWAELMKRPELSYTTLAASGAGFGAPAPSDALPYYVKEAAIEEVNDQIKLSGYIKLAVQQADAFIKMENKPIPAGINYAELHGLRIEARQRLAAVLPANMGQASRIPGVSPADMQALAIYIKTLSHG